MEAKQFNQLIGLVSIIEGPSEATHGIKRVERFSEYGTLLRITSEETNVFQYLTTSNQNNQNYKIYSALAFARFRIVNILKNSPYYLANVELMTDELLPAKEQELYKQKLIADLKQSAQTYFEMIRMTDHQKSGLQLEQEKSVNKLIFTIAAHMEMSHLLKIRFLQIDTHAERIQFLLKNLNEKNEEFKVTRDIEEKVMKEIQNPDPTFKRQLSIQKNPGYMSKKQDDLEERVQRADLPEHVRQQVEEDLKKLNSMGGRNAESDVLRSYLELVISLPWNTYAEETLKLDKAQEILDRDHCGLTKVKERILQFLAVRQLLSDKSPTKDSDTIVENKELKSSKGTGSILCFHGPPGVGKTSLGQSIAESLNRPFYRLALGGVRDEASIRGHRRTYVAAMPGQLILAMKKIKCKNPVILLDEIDKLSRDRQGDPSSALLEVLDPEQNMRFMDHYLGIEFDLSQVLFIATANNIQTIQAPLLDRLELISIPGYSREDKISIASSHLIPKQLSRHGLVPTRIEIQDSREIISKIIQDYTAEAGVRQLERNIAALLRNAALQIVKGEKKDKIVFTLQSVKEILGAPKTHDQNPSISCPGIARGLAWTSVGGKVLMVESVKMPGKGRIEVTGQLGDIMKESVKAALGFIKSNWQNLQKYIPIEEQLNNKKGDEYFDNLDLHVHFPAGAIPKDGPSAGITIATALVSLIVDKKVRDDIAMTGEITLTGQVLPVGGIKEKMLAAYEAGIKTCILPASNQHDVADIETKISQDMSFLFVRNISEVLDIALGGPDLIVSSKSILKQSKL